MTVTPALARIPVGVVVTRSKAASPWADFIWRPVSVLAGVPAAAPWTVLAQTDEEATFYAGAAEIALYRTETTYYRNNIASGTPLLWVALRPTEAEPPYEVFTVTADPAEGESLTEAGNDLVDVVPMPDAVRAIVEAFIAEHHVEQPFVKRKRDRADPQALARRGRMQTGHDE